MAVAEARLRGQLRARARSSSPVLLGALVGVSFLVHALAAWARATPTYFPDEYLYAELGRSIASGGLPLVRGEWAAFPALLQPLVTAPGWLAHDVGLGFHLVQTIEALVASLAAVPAFWLATRLRLSTGVALAIAALTVSIPDLVYTGFVIAEPIAYPLVLGAIAAGTAALAAPTRRAQIAFVALAVLAAFARLQFAALPLCFLAATVLVGARERRLRTALREQLLPLALFALPLLALAAAPARLLGVYRGLFDYELDPTSVLHWSAATAMTLVYSAGVALVPGALLGTALLLARPRSRAELAFGSLLAFVAAAVLAQAGLVAANGPEHVFERYAFYLLPLAATAFALYAARGWPARPLHALLAVGLVAMSARIPLAGFAAADQKEDSPLLFAVARLEQAAGEAGTGSLAVAAAAAALAGSAILASRRPAIGAQAVLWISVAVCALSSIGAAAFDQENAAGLRREQVGADASWIDRAAHGPVTQLAAPGAERSRTLGQLFWNRSLDRLVLLPGSRPVDQFGVARARISRTGVVLVGAAPLETPFAVDDGAAQLVFRDAAVVARSGSFSLWRPLGRAQLALALQGRYPDGWLAAPSRIRLWPAGPSEPLRGFLRIVLTVPARSHEVTVRVSSASSEELSVLVAPGKPVAARLRVCADGPWQAQITGTPARFLVGAPAVRAVSARELGVAFRPSARACA